MAHTRVLFINDVKRPFLLPQLTLPTFTPLSSLTALWREKSLSADGGGRKKKKKSSHSSLPCRPVKRRASLLQQGLEARVCTYTAHSHSRSHTHTHARTHEQKALSLVHTTTWRRAGSQAGAHCRLPLAWESLMRPSLQAEAHPALSKPLCWG